MIKFANIGDFKVAQNFGYLKTPVVLENGMAVTYDLKTKAVALPTAITAKQAGLAVVMNRIDKPETLTPNDYRIDRPDGGMDAGPWPCRPALSEPRGRHGAGLLHTGNSVSLCAYNGISPALHNRRAAGSY